MGTTNRCKLSVFISEYVNARLGDRIGRENGGRENGGLRKGNVIIGFHECLMLSHGFLTSTSFSSDCKVGPNPGTP